MDKNTLEKRYDREEILNRRILHVCEVCGRTEHLTPEEAFDQGWDYPPNMGEFRVISPRTCGNCSIQSTVWWKLCVEKIPLEKLSDEDQKTVERILKEPDILFVECEEVSETE